MAVTLNARGTSFGSFKIGKGGPTITADADGYLTIADGVGTEQPLGYNTIPIYEIDANDTFDLAHAGMMWHKDSGAAVTFTCDNDSTIPQGTTWIVHNDDTEDLTIAEGTGVTVAFIASGAAPATGDVTVSQGGIVTVYKYTDTEYWVWGDDGPFNILTAGATTDSTLRWNGTAWAEETQVQIAADGTLTILDSGLTDSVAMSHDGTDFTFNFTNTAAVDFIGMDTINFGDPGFESGSIQLNGTSFDAVVKINEYGGSQDAALVLHRHDDTPGVAANLVMSRARGETTGHTDVASGDTLGRIAATGWNTASYYRSAEIHFYVDGTPGVGDMPGRIAWATSADGSSTPTEWMQLRASGALEMYDSTGSDFVSFSHDGTDFNIAGTNTTDINITGIAGFNVVNYSFDVDQTVGSGQDGYSLRYDDATGLISLQPSPGGASVQGVWQFDNTTTEANPGAGQFRNNNGTIGSVTEIFIHKEDERGGDFDNLLAALTAGDSLYIQNIEDASEFLLFDITANVDNTDWFSIAGTVNSSGSNFTDGKEFGILLLFGGTGGGNFAQIGGTPVDNQIAVWNSADTIEGDANFTWDGTGLAITNLLETGDAFIGRFNSNDETWIDAAVNGSVDLYYNGSIALATDTNGIRVVDASGSDLPELAFYNSANNSQLGRMYYNTTDLYIENESHGGALYLTGEDGTGNNRTFLRGEPDGITFIQGDTNVQINVSNGTEVAATFTGGGGITFNYAGASAAAVIATTSGGFEIDNDLTSGTAGRERALTEADLEAGQPRLRYYFETLTTTPPGTGRIRFDNSTMASVTNLYMHDTSDNGLDGSRVLNNLADGDVLTIGDERDPADYIVVSVNGTPTDNTTYWTVPVTVIHSGTTPANANIVTVDVQWLSQTPSPTGVSTVDPILSGRWQYDSSLSAGAPDNQSFRMNSGTSSSASVMRLDDDEIGGLDAGDILGNISAGSHVKIYDADDPTIYIVYGVASAPSDQTGYWNVSLDYVEGSAFPADTTECVVQFFSGGYVGQGTSTTNNARDVLLWDVNSDSWQPSGSGLRFNTNSPPVGGRIQVNGSASSDTERAVIYMNSGASVSGLWYANGGTNEAFYAQHLGNSNPAEFVWGFDNDTTETDMIAINQDLEFVVKSEAALMLEEKAAANTDTAGQGQIWVKNDTPNNLYFTDDTGQDVQITNNGALNVSGFVDTSGTPANNQIAIFTDADTIEGDAKLTFNSGASSVFNLDANDVTFRNDAGTNWLAYDHNGAGSAPSVTLTSALAIEGTRPVIYFAEQATADADFAGYGQLWVFNGTPNALYFTDDAGNDYGIVGGGLDPIVRATGTPVNNQLAIWTDADTVEGSSKVTYNSASNGTFTIDADVINLRDDAGADLFVLNADGAGPGTPTANLSSALAILGDRPVIYLLEQAAADDDFATYGQIWVKDDAPNNLYFTDDTGQDIQITNNGAVVGAPTEATVTTVNATQTELLALSIASGTSVGYEATVIGREDATGDTVLEKITGLISNEAGTTALIDTPDVNRHESAGASAWTITVAADDTSDELTFDVTGEASHTIDWKINITTIVV